MARFEARLQRITSTNRLIGQIICLQCALGWNLLIALAAHVKAAALQAILYHMQSCMGIAAFTETAILSGHEDLLSHLLFRGIHSMCFRIALSSYNTLGDTELRSCMACHIV